MAVDLPSGAFPQGRALQIIEESGLLNPYMALKDVMELSRKISTRRPMTGKGGAISPLGKIDDFIHRNFVLNRVETKKCNGSRRPLSRIVATRRRHRCWKQSVLPLGSSI